MLGVSRKRSVHVNSPQYWKPLDLGDSEGFQKILEQFRPDIVVHAAALASVDECEIDPARAFVQNVEISERLAMLVQRASSRFVFISTDAFFDVDGQAALEKDIPRPCNVYGESKAEAEKRIAVACPGALIVRTNFFGWSGSPAASGTGIVDWLVGSLKAEKPIPLFADVEFCPLYVRTLVEAILELSDQGRSGIVHLLGSDRVSKHDFGLMVAAELGSGISHVFSAAISSADLRAKRSKRMWLSNALSRQWLPHFDFSLATSVQRLAADMGDYRDELFRMLSA